MDSLEVRFLNNGIEEFIKKHFLLDALSFLKNLLSIVTKRLKTKCVFIS